MAKTVKKTATPKKVVAPIEKEVTSQYPVGYDPDMPENKQRHLR